MHLSAIFFNIAINLNDIIVILLLMTEFTFTESEQAFYKEKGFENEPQRCPSCRKARKQQRNNNNRGGGFGGGNRW